VSKDGMAKNAEKMLADYHRLKEMPDGHPSDWLKQPWNAHHWVDMFVESGRHGDYLMGHWWSVYFPVSMIIMVWLSLS
jgi:hypothetical protein